MEPLVYFSFHMAILETTLLYQRKGNVTVKVYFSNNFMTSATIEEDLSPLNLKESIQKTRQALEIAYAGFDNAVDPDLIDSYIFEINALQKRYHHLIDLAATQPEPEKDTLYQHSPIRALVSHVFG